MNNKIQKNYLYFLYQELVYFEYLSLRMENLGLLQFNCKKININNGQTDIISIEVNDLLGIKNSCQSRNHNTKNENFAKIKIYVKIK